MYEGSRALSRCTLSNILVSITFRKFGFRIYVTLIEASNRRDLSNGLPNNWLTCPSKLPQPVFRLDVTVVRSATKKKIQNELSGKRSMLQESIRGSRRTLLQHQRPAISRSVNAYIFPAVPPEQRRVLPRDISWGTRGPGSDIGMEYQGRGLER